MFFQKLVSRENILFDEFFVGKRLVSKQLARKKAGLGHISRPSACLLCPVVYTMAAFGIFSSISTFCTNLNFRPQQVKNPEK